MDRFYNAMWKFETANFRVVWSITDCEDLDLSWDDTGEVKERLESGEYIAFDSEMNVIYKPTGQEIGASYLGQSIYDNPKDFMDHLGCRSKGYGSYFSDMVRDAIKEARKNVAMYHDINLRSVKNEPSTTCD
jgi:hypothetical protein